MKYIPGMRNPIAGKRRRGSMIVNLLPKKETLIATNEEKKMANTIGKTTVSTRRCENNKMDRAQIMSNEMMIWALNV
jgi:hypothetical protein